MQRESLEFHTGLFVDRRKCLALLEIVQRLLGLNHLSAFAGPPLANNTCEVLLRPLGIGLHSFGVNIVAAKVLLEKYLSMVKDPGLETMIQKEPELIDLSSDDDSEEPSVVIVDLDQSGTSCRLQSSDCNVSPNIDLLDSITDSLLTPDKSKSFSESISDKSTTVDLTAINVEDSVLNLSIVDVCNIETVEKSDSSFKSPHSDVSRSNCSKYSQGDVNEGKSSAIVNNVDADIVCVNWVKRNPPPSKLPLNKDILPALKNSNENVKNRKLKRKFLKENVKDVDIVEIADDDVIVIDESMAASDPFIRLSKPGGSVLELDIADDTEKTPPHRETLADPLFATTSSISSSKLPQTSRSIDGNESSENENAISSEDNGQNSGPPKKKSKLSYRRPAHLVTPLTQSTPASGSSKVDPVTNIYNPNAGSVEKRSGLRPIVIDGNNVAIGHGKGTFSLKGIEICINYFEKRGHRQIKVFVPQYRHNRDTHDKLHAMERKGLVVITPSRRVNGKVVASYDDRYIVQYAAEFGGVVVSTDNFRDLLGENPNWKETIEKRLLMFTWVDDLLMFPQDPLGRRGPSLDDFLKFPD